MYHWVTWVVNLWPGNTGGLDGAGVPQGNGWDAGRPQSVQGEGLGCFGEENYKYLDIIGASCLIWRPEGFILGQMTQVGGAGHGRPRGVGGMLAAPRLQGEDFGCFGVGNWGMCKTQWSFLFNCDP